MKSALLTIVVALSPLTAAQLSDRPGSAVPAPQQPTADAPTINVVFHGLFAFVVWRNYVEVLAPQVDDHVYKAGSWGDEVRLKEGVKYRLTGVRSASAVPAIDPATNVVLDKHTNINRNKSKLFCSIRFPLPAQMKSLRRVAATPSEMFHGVASAHIQCRQVPLLEVFVYAIDDPAKLSLGGNLPWRPSIGPDNTVNLHVWAEPEALVSPMGAAHPMEAFTRLMALFPGLDLQLMKSGVAPPDPATNIRGLNFFEQKTLRERSSLVDKPVGNLSGGGADVTSCLPLIIRNDKP